MQQLLGHSITYRAAVGASQGQKVFTLQTVPAHVDGGNDQVAKVAGFSLHAGLVALHWERKKLERLCRYITRPAISEKRLSVTPAGNIRYQLKTPYRDGTTHVVFERGGPPSLDFLAKLAALIPKPRVNLTRFHGVFAGTPDRANSRFRSEVTPARRGRRSGQSDKTTAERRRAMSWAQRLKRVFTNSRRFKRHRCRDLPALWWQSESAGMYRRPANHRSHFKSSGQERYLAYTDESFAREQRTTRYSPVILTIPLSRFIYSPSCFRVGSPVKCYLDPANNLKSGLRTWLYCKRISKISPPFNKTAIIKLVDPL